MVYEESQKKFTGVLKQVEEEVGKYLETQSTADSTVFMDESFDNLQRYSNLFNILPFVPVVVGMAVTHHALLTSLWVNVSHFPLKIFLSPLESDCGIRADGPAPVRDSAEYCCSGGSGEDGSGSES